MNVLGIGIDLVDVARVERMIKRKGQRVTQKLLTPREQARVIELLVERVEYVGREGTVAITLRPSGIRVLPEQNGESGEERP